MSNRLKTLLPFLVILILLTLFSAPSAQEFDKVQVKTIKATDQVYMLMGSGGNIGVFVGKDGIRCNSKNQILIFHFGVFTESGFF
jgi:hypothetical protein